MGFSKHEKIENSKKAKREYDYSKLDNKEDVKNLKYIAKYDFLNKQLYGQNGWYNNLKKVNGMIDWDNIEESVIEAFDVVYKDFEKICKKVNDMDDVYISMIKTKAKNSYGYGGSF
tara:strand:- start:1104 stop:1451 length:348 start_codon:yes stop_codon:yes gene_type:complete